jgi:hypothetical protein
MFHTRFRPNINTRSLTRQQGQTVKPGLFFVMTIHDEQQHSRLMETVEDVTCGYDSKLVLSLICKWMRRIYPRYLSSFLNFE